MDYHIVISENNDHLLLKILKPMTLEIVIAAYEELIKIGKGNNIFKMLADLRNLEIKTNNIDRYEFAYTMSEKLGLDRNWKLAILKDKNSTAPDFFETVMTNVGYDCKAFTKLEDAEDWLENKKLP
ncbi:MAG: hypothetical protein JEY94_16900 [Melioribacteraceae bacterium]|nr:hypothetical protein [Melioribacteraceae bacterium]